MALPELVRRSTEKRVREFCEKRVPTHVRDQVRLEMAVRGNAITILERRPLFESRPDVAKWSSMKIAQLRYDARRKEWTLYWPDRNGKWNPYWDLDPAEDVEVLLWEIDEDPTGIFWG